MQVWNHANICESAVTHSKPPAIKFVGLNLNTTKMKKMKFLFGLLAIGALTLTSCNSDDDNDTVIDNSNGIAGTYALVEYRTPGDTDIDKDGTAHPNQIDETDCYDDSSIVFNADNTLTYNYRSITISEGIGTCATAAFGGTWEITGSSGNTVNIRATYQNATNQQVTLNFAKNGNRLTQTTLIAQYPNVVNNVLVYSTGTVTLVFEK